MDLTIYVDAVMQKLEDAKYYSEIEKVELRFIINKYLKNEYNDRIALLNLEVDMEQAKGTLRDSDYYRTKLNEIKSYMITLTREIGQIKKD
tara:strand:- start:830 stop:1102 length:273 start_codon:yes stop_codon:yes gene_type:complete